MHLWATRQLADEIIAGDLTTRDKVTYFVVFQVLLIALGYASGLGTRQFSWLYLYEAILVVVVTFAGAQKVVSSYSNPVDAEFFETTYLLSVPLFVKTTLVAWIAIYGGHWLFAKALPHISTESEGSARLLTYWLPRLWDLLPFLVGVVVVFIFWIRLAHHLRYVVAKRGA